MVPQSCIKRVIRCVTVEPVLLLFMFASSLTFSAFMAMTYDKTCLTLYNDTLCDELNNRTVAREHKEKSDAVQELASSWFMRGNIAITVPATLSLVLCLGSWGDRVGRRLPLLVPCVAAMVYSVSNILNAHYMHGDLAYTLVGPVFSGLGGSYLAVLMAGYTYLTHLANTGNRMMRVGVAESAVFLSSTISVFVSGLLVDHLGYMPTFGIALGCQTLAVLYILFLLPEVKTQDSSATPTSSPSDCATCCKGAFFTSMRDMWGFLTAQRDGRVKVHLGLFILVLNILQLCTTGENDILLLYLKRNPRNWTYTTYGYFKGAENFTRGAAVLLLLPLLKKKTPLKDTSLILAGLVSKIGALVLLGLAQKTWTIFLVVAVAALQGFPSAGLRSLLACLVLNEEQGRLFGLVASTESVVSFTSTLLFNGLYPQTLSFYDGFCFQLAASFVVICFVIVLCQHFDLMKTNRWILERLSSADIEEKSVQTTSSRFCLTDPQSCSHTAADTGPHSAPDFSLPTTSVPL